jgi:hypothetical protein
MLDMRKILYFLLFILCLGNNYIFANQVNNTIDDEQSTELARMYVAGLTEENFSIENKEMEGKNLKFNLKISIPSEWMLDSNEPQETGRPMTIKLKNDESGDRIVVNFPISQEHKTDSGDSKITNHVYIENATIPITIKKFNKNDTLVISYLLCGGEGNCIPGEQEIIINK